ncbi:phosphatidylinositol-glycan biosynthesis class S protein-domain-containing protein [Auriculariales sp. MPI-PUGE-AT-0066]|nr:phosphatidylinositol-glycan biosynthesis class S protein-domain-containing protein [Auriculariales sp. MPI-PUGE-AT-0066]
MSGRESFDPIQRATVLFQHDPLRVRIIASYLAIFVCCAPAWWYLTSITRLPLPTARVEQLGWTEDVKFPLNIAITRSSSDERVRRSNEAEVEHALHARIQHADPAWHTLDVRISSAEGQLANENSTDTFIVAIVDYLAGASHLVGDHTLSLAGDSANASQIIDLLQELLLPYASRRHEVDQQRVAKYSPRYRLAFTLLNEDVSTSGFHSWEIQEAIQDYLEPTLKQLRSLHEFEIETQVQYFAPLGFESERRADDEGQQFHALSSEELKVFVNSAEWSLASSVSADPVLHFILFVPSARHSPTHVINSQGNAAQSNAFIIPQWGGIVVLNPSTPHGQQLDVHTLLPVFKTFHKHLQLLLGISGIPRGTFHVPTSSQPLTKWQLSALQRWRTLENVREATDALRSTIKLIHRIGHLPVKEDVRTFVNAALDDLDELRGALARPHASLARAFDAARDASVHASSAFFHPGMLAMLYFPPEHTYAVYGPLFAYVGVTLLSALVREIQRVRKEREQNHRRMEKDKGRKEGERSE